MTTFIDTNVLLYSHTTRDQRRHEIALAALDALWATGTGVLSTQVLQEFYAVATRKLQPPLEPAQARQVVADYSEWCFVETTPQLIISASLLSEEHTIAFWDALIVEAALLTGATTMLSEDMQDGRRFGPLTVHNPFVVHPS